MASTVRENHSTFACLSDGEGKGILVSERVRFVRRGAHGIDERLPLESYYEQLTFWDVLLKDLAGEDDQ